MSVIKEHQKIYDEGYFHGKNSGYPPEGYENAHPSWKGWIDFVKAKTSAGRWLDVGCAYGYLVREARETGIDAIGIDVSEYALRQLPDVKDHLSLQEAHKVSFGDSEFDVVSCFDTIEHLENPERGLIEWKRVLKSGGWLIISTPDPIYLREDEVTHCNEHPPSYWVKLLKNMGFSVSIRFPGQIYNVEILAVNDGRGAFLEQDMLGIDHLDDSGDICDASGISSQDLHMCLRSNWSVMKDGMRNVLEGKSGGIYLLNLSKSSKKIRCSVKFNCVTNDKLFVTLDQVKIHTDETITPIPGGNNIAEFEFFLPHGGHLLGISMLSGIRVVSIAEEDVDPKQARMGYLADQYIRYSFVGDVFMKLKKDDGVRLNILDVGGAPGQIHDFVPEEEILVLDNQWCDMPGFIKGDFLAEDFQRKFDLVLSADTLEHISGDMRGEFLDKLMDLSNGPVIIISPFRSSDVEKAEEVLYMNMKAGLGIENKYLEEHKEYRLPDKEKVKNMFTQKGYSCEEVPLFNLKHWMFIMFYDFACDKAGIPLHERDRSYNEDFEKMFHSAPSYEMALFFSKNSVDMKTVSMLTEKHKKGSCFLDNSFEGHQIKLMSEFAKFNAEQINIRENLFRELNNDVMRVTGELNNLACQVKNPSIRFAVKVVKNFIFRKN